MRIISVLILAALLLAAACSSTPSNNGEQASNMANQTDQPANTAAVQPAGSSLSPTETLRALNDAAKKHDPEAIKRYLSEGTMKLLEQSAEKQKRSVDDILREEQGPPFLELPQIGKESINGDSATVEIKSDEMEEYDALPFVREDGSWKVAIDLYLKSLDLETDDSGTAPADNRPEPQNDKK